MKIKKTVKYENLTSSMKKTEFYKSMYDEILKINKNNIFFDVEDEKEKIVVIDRIIDKYLLKQLKEITKEIPVIIKNMDIKGKLNNKEKEFDGKGMHERVTKRKSSISKDFVKELNFTSLYLYKDVKKEVIEME